MEKKNRSRNSSRPGTNLVVSSADQKPLGRESATADRSYANVRELITKTKNYHGGARHGGQATDTEKCPNNKSKSKIKTQSTEKAGAHRNNGERAEKICAKNDGSLREKKEVQH
jgi:hypothetical protein